MWSLIILPFALGMAVRVFPGFFAAKKINNVQIARETGPLHSVNLLNKRFVLTIRMRIP